MKKPNNCLDGFRCPTCGNAEEFSIVAIARFTVRDDGTGDARDVEWGNKSSCQCTRCKKMGLVEDFKWNKERKKRGAKSPANNRY